MGHSEAEGDQKSGALSGEEVRRSSFHGARALVASGLLPLSALLAAALAHASPAAVERLYSSCLYPALAAIVGAPARWFAAVGPSGPALEVARPSLGELLALASALLALWLIVRAARRGLASFVRTALILAGAASWTFLLCWGFNYAREPLAQRLGLTPAPPRDGQLFELATGYAAELESALDALGPDWSGGVDFAEEAASAWGRARIDEPALGRATNPVLVAPLASPLLVMAGITGIFGPFSQEAHVARGLVPLDQGFGACHEVAHLQGWAREDEANYLAFRVCTRYGSPPLTVCGYAGALRHVLRALRNEDRGLWTALVSGLDERIIALFEDRRIHWNTRRNVRVSKAASRVNDAYLKSNAQGDGVGSYGRMVDLLIAESNLAQAEEAAARRAETEKGAAPGTDPAEELSAPSEEGTER